MDSLIFLAIAQLIKRRSNELASGMPHLDTVEAVRRTHRLVASATALRSLLSAHGHSVEEPAPKYSELAAAQEVSPSGIVRRYNADMADALRNYDKSARALQRILDATPSISASELVGLDDELDELLFELGAIPERGRASTRTLTPVTLKDLLKPANAEVNTIKERAKIDDLNANAARTLGHLMNALRSLLSNADWADQWISGPSTGVVIEWKGGPSIDEALAVLCPVAIDGTHASGVQALLIGEQTQHFARLTYATDPETEVQMRRWA